VDSNHQCDLRQGCVPRTCPFALHMSANDPKRTSAIPDHPGMSGSFVVACRREWHDCFLDLGNP
jgi:hypothetical protein